MSLLSSANTTMNVRHLAPFFLVLSFRLSLRPLLLPVLVITSRVFAVDIEQKTRTFVGRTAQLEILGKYVDGTATAPLLVTGDAGSGKSALLANFVRHQRDNGPVSLSVVYHFVGASPMSTNPRHMLWRTTLLSPMSCVFSSLLISLAHFRCLLDHCEVLWPVCRG